MAVEVRRPDQKEDDGLNKVLAIANIASTVSGMSGKSGAQQKPPEGDETAMGRRYKAQSSQNRGYV